MALGQIAPWLRQPDVLELMEAGGRLGLSAHQTELDASLRRAELSQRAAESAAKLGLDSTALNFQHQAEMEKVKAANALKMRGLDLAEGRLDLGRDTLAQKEDYQNAGLDLRDKSIDARTDYQNKLIETRLKALEQQKNKTVPGAVPLESAGAEPIENPADALYSAPTLPSPEGETLPLPKPLHPSIYMGPKFGVGIEDVPPADTLPNDDITSPIENKTLAIPGVEEPNRIKVISPNGKHGTIPISQLNDALSQGYQRIE